MLPSNRPNDLLALDSPNNLAEAITTDFLEAALEALPVVTKPATLRIFPATSVALAPYNCRLCESGWCTPDAFRDHIKDAHGPLAADTHDVMWTVAEQFAKRYCMRIRRIFRILYF